MVNCITECVDHLLNEHHERIGAEAGHGAAALASPHDDNLQSSLSPPRSPSPAHGGASTPPPPHEDHASSPVPPDHVPLPESVLRDVRSTLFLVSQWLTLKSKLQRHVEHGAKAKSTVQNYILFVSQYASMTRQSWSWTRWREAKVIRMLYIVIVTTILTHQWLYFTSSPAWTSRRFCTVAFLSLNGWAESQIKTATAPRIYRLLHWHL